MIHAQQQRTKKNSMKMCCIMLECHVGTEMSRSSMNKKWMAKVLQRRKSRDLNRCSKQIDKDIIHSHFLACVHFARPQNDPFIQLFGGVNDSTVEAFMHSRVAIPIDLYIMWNATDLYQMK